MNSIRPNEVVERYLDANTIEERRIAHQIYLETSSLELAFLACELGYDRFDCGPNSAWHDSMRRNR